MSTLQFLEKASAKIDGLYLVQATPGFTLAAWGAYCIVYVCGMGYGEPLGMASTNVIFGYVAQLYLPYSGIALCYRGHTYGVRKQRNLAVELLCRQWPQCLKILAASDNNGVHFL